MVIIKSPNQTKNKAGDKNYNDGWDRVFGKKELKLKTDKFKYSGKITLNDFAAILSMLEGGKEYKVKIEEI